MGIATALGMTILGPAVAGMYQLVVDAFEHRICPLALVL